MEEYKKLPEQMDDLKFQMEQMAKEQAVDSNKNMEVIMKQQQ